MPLLQNPIIGAGEATDHAHRLLGGTILDAPDGALSLDLARMIQAVQEERPPLPGLWRAARKPASCPEAIWEVQD